MWLEEKEEKRDAYHLDDGLWGKDITQMVVRVVAAMKRVHSEKRNADTGGGSLEAAIHADLTQTGGPKKPEKRHSYSLECSSI